MTKSKARWSVLLALLVVGALAAQPRWLHAQSSLVDGGGISQPPGDAGDPDNPTDGKSMSSTVIGSGSAPSGYGSIYGRDLRTMDRSRSTSVASAPQPVAVNSRLWVLIWAIRSYFGW